MTSDKFALQIYAITLEAVPPGHEPKIIKPSAISFGKSKMTTKRNAKKGIIENCKIIVVNSHFGSVRIFLFPEVEATSPYQTSLILKGKGIEDLSSVNSLGKVKLNIKNIKINKIKLNLYTNIHKKIKPRSLLTFF